jgi:response regulator RpfG family c-di-GMP phosphodiesterase
MMEAIEEQLQDVLIADDDREDFEIVSDIIKSLPIKVVVTRAENGDILMKLIHERKPDLLLLDLVLPCKDGKACIKEIRKNKDFDDLPIIVYTSLRDLESIEFCFREGTNLYVFKPDTYSEIVQIVEKIFSFSWKKVRYFPTRTNFVLNP